jgi:hypothetical protein
VSDLSLLDGLPQGGVGELAMADRHATSKQF